MYPRRSLEYVMPVHVQTHLGLFIKKKNNIFTRFISLNIVMVSDKMCKQDKLYKAAL